MPKDRDLSDFDRDQIELLRPLAEAHAVARIPVFANTLPLGLHFGLAADEFGGPRPRFVDWNAPIGTIKLDKSSITIFYALESDLADLRLSAKKAGCSMVERLCTVYKPHLLFLGYVPFRDATFANDQNPRPFDERLAAELGSTYDQIEVYSDTHQQARDLIEGLKREYKEYGLTKVVPMFDLDYRTIRLPPPSVRSVAMYFYSAPLTSLLWSEPSSYVPIELPRGVLSQGISANTYVCLIHGPAIEAKTARAFGGDLYKYHKRQYDMALNGTAMSFLDACAAYNRLSKNRLLREVFRNAQAYAECLASHHDYERMSEREG